MQAGDYTAARPLFQYSFELSAVHHFDDHTCNAAHMVALVAQTPEEKIQWNLRAITLAEQTESSRARRWLGSLYHNLGQAYIEAKQYEKALAFCEKALSLREQEGYAPNVRTARWAMARALRFLNRLDEAFPILLDLIKTYDAMVETHTLDIPSEMVPALRGLVYEELAEIHATKTKEYAKLACEDLSKDEWFKKLEPRRWERLKELQENG
jgi:tetratricopeptide (TPR) repeat protein